MKITDDNYLPLCLAAAETWPAPTWPHWHRYNYEHSNKYATKDPDRISRACRLLVDHMSCLWCPAGTFPDLNLHGAGMHWIREGGFLGKHRDSDVHPITGWYRKWNAILFLSDCEGGELLVDGCEPIKPKLGRMVQFDSHVPHEVLPVTSGDRKSVSLFWWSLDGEGDSLQATFI